ncbi:MAG: hypothetical protein C0594_13705 [Marinilabiliales bacterium]|nr:MAG: hypothetical protein C0594_13705 [Marinilabiliales bacterium]
MKRRLKKTAYFVAFICLVACVYVFISLSPVVYRTIQSDHMNNVTVAAHRGASSLAPENSLLAVQKALELGVDRIEIDIHQTKDSILVVMHDAKIDRMTKGKGKISNLTFNELRQFELLPKNEDEEKQLIPSLEEVLQLINGSVTLLIEVKGSGKKYPGIEKRLVQMIKDFDAYSWTQVMAFDDDVLETVNSLDGDICLNKLLGADPIGLPFIFDTGIRFKKIEDYTYVSEFSVLYKFANRNLINKVHAMNKKLNAWTVDDKETMQSLQALGVDGIITNYPQYLLKK